MSSKELAKPLTHQREETVKPIRRRLMVPLSAVLLLLACGIGIIVVSMQQTNLKKLNQQALGAASGELAESLAEQSEALAALGLVLTRDAALRMALKRGDREQLLETNQSIFTQLREKHAVTHFYFHRPDRVNLLRVHKPEKYGDRIHRFTLLAAERTGAVSAGVELGPLGTFTLRSVRPVMEGKTLVGYLELGKEIEDILVEIHKKKGVELVVTILKSVLNRTEWEAGMAMLGRDADWGGFTEKVITYSSIIHFPTQCRRFIQEEEYPRQNATAEMEFNGASWRARVDPLKDVSGATVGDLLILNDISREKTAYVRLLVMVLLWSGAMLAGLFWFLFTLLRRTDQGIRKQQTELVESESFLRSLIGAMPDYVLVLDTGGRIRKLIRGHPDHREEDVVGLDAAAFLPPEYGEAFREALRLVVDTGQLQMVKTMLNLPDGQHYVLNRLSLTALAHEDNSILLISTDMTELKLAEDERNKLEKQLGRTKKLETIGTLAGGIAHDFNNILAPIMGYTDMALAGLEKNDPLYRDLQNVLKGTHRAKDLVEQILLFSKQIEKDREPVSLQMQIEEVLKLLEPSFPDTINVRQQIDESCKNVWADATQMHQVIVNLCTNACQAMEENGGTLTIKLFQVDIDAATAELFPNLNNPQYACLSITDTGIGMDKKTNDRVFEPFFTTKSVDKGTGLGLSVVHGIVRGHQGDINVYSEPGKGTSVKVYLPIFDAGNVKVKDISEKSFEGTESILIVDDEPSITEMVSKMLKKFGYKTDVRSSGLTALEAFKQQPGKYDLLVSDLTMPNMSGLDLIDHIHKQRPEFPVVVLTGFGNILTPDAQQRYGIKQVIGKPIVVRELVAAVRRILDKS